MSSTTQTVGQIARQAGVTSTPREHDVPVVVQTASGKERVVTGAHFDGRRLVLTTGK
jgi:hypothetical protein